MTASLATLWTRIRSLERLLGETGAGVGAAGSVAGAIPLGTPGGAAEVPFASIVLEAAGRHGLDPALVRAVVWAESGFNPAATSSAGAMGLMQLMPGTARALGVRNPYDPQENIEAGTRYLASLVRRYGDAAMALAGYNAGPGAVARYGGIPPFPETRRYIDRVLTLWARWRHPDGQSSGEVTRADPGR